VRGGRAPEAALEQPDLARPEDFRDFYRASLSTVYGYFVNRCGSSRHVAEDLTQETFMAAVTELRRGAWPTTPSAWIMGIAKHKLIDHFRRERRSERKLLVLIESERPGDLPDWTDGSRDRARDALARLPAAQRQALVLRYLDGFGVEEVAKSLGRSIHATESLLVRGRESFRRSFLDTAEVPR
jgi:RNA polymerase sigma-70 factor, ECF subfamily